MRIWFNQGFSLAAIARTMMAADPALEVCVSVGAGKPAYAGPTDTWAEPDLKAEDYVAWVRQMVRDHAVDVLVPTRQRWHIAGADMGCRVELAATRQVLELLDDKFAFAQTLRGEGCYLPTQTVASTAELREMLARFRRERPDASPCVKPRVGVNGHGYWRLTQDAPMAYLMYPDARMIHEELYLATLAAQEEDSPFSPLVLMEYLPGPEVSVDVLAWRGTALHGLARTKQGNRQKIASAHELIPLAARLVERFGLNGMVNVQFRRADDGSWKVLEINPRAAGGSVYAAEFGGRLVADWGGLISGRLTPDTIDRTPLDIELEFSQSLVAVPPAEAAQGVAA